VSERKRERTADKTRRMVMRNSQAVRELQQGGDTNRHTLFDPVHALCVVFEALFGPVPGKRQHVPQ
jgi:hypothetical protein